MARRTRTKKDDGYVQVSFFFFFVASIKKTIDSSFFATAVGRTAPDPGNSTTSFRYHDDRKGKGREGDKETQKKRAEREREKKDAGQNTCPATQEPTTYSTAPSFSLSACCFTS